MTPEEMMTVPENWRRGYDDGKVFLVLHPALLLSVRSHRCHDRCHGKDRRDNTEGRNTKAWLFLPLLLLLLCLPMMVMV